MTAQQFFIAGCPRSGTSALAALLSRDPRVVVGLERFKRVRKQLEPLHFSEEVFFAPAPHETDIAGLDHYRRQHERWRSGSVTLIGDKVPFYADVLDRLDARFPQFKLVFCLRALDEVGASYEHRAQSSSDHWPAENGFRRAAQDWNRTLHRVRDFADAGNADRTFIVPYAAFFAGDERWTRALRRFLDLPFDASVEPWYAAWAARQRERAPRDLPLDEAARRHLAAERDEEVAQWARERIEAQCAQYAELDRRDPWPSSVHGGSALEPEETDRIAEGEIRRWPEQLDPLAESLAGRVAAAMDELDQRRRRLEKAERRIAKLERQRQELTDRLRAAEGAPRRRWLRR